VGMFDSVYVRCNCGKDVEFQSKAGPCICAPFTLEDCPPAVGGDIIGQSQQCKCGAVTKIHGQLMLFASCGGGERT
jgi:hypothetical protein